jgi:SET domain-containing protein 6
LEILEDGYCVPHPSPEDSLADILPDELLALLKTLTLTPEQLLQQKSKNKPPKPAFALPEAQLLLATVQKRASQYPTSIEQDEEILNRLRNAELLTPLEGSPRRQKMAIQVRLGEKEIIRQLYAMLTDYIESANKNGEGSSSAKRNAPGDTDRPRKAKIQKT